MENYSIFKYSTLCDADWLWGVTITTVGHHKISDAQSYPPAEHPSRYYFDAEKGRTLDEYQLLYITRGGGTFNSKRSGEITLKEGDICMVFPNQWHTYQPNPETGWDEYWVGFKGEKIDKLLRNNFFNPSTPRQSIGLNEEIVSLYNKMIEVALSEKQGLQQLLAGILSHIIGLIYSGEHNTKADDNNTRTKIDRARVVMQESVNSNISLENLAESLSMSYSWFRRAFKEQAGATPAKYMNILKLQRAKTMLVESNKSIKEISLSLGFENIDYFSTFFKKYTSKTPIEYRACSSKNMEK